MNNHRSVIFKAFQEQRRRQQPACRCAWDPRECAPILKTRHRRLDGCPVDMRQDAPMGNGVPQAADAMKWRRPAEHAAREAFSR